jgi:NAD(P)H dehydrogenase (quinone)
MTPKVVIIYDSKTGNTELMAKAVAQGLCDVEGVEADLHKLGTKFPMSILEDADAIIVGSPTIYGNITDELAFFFTNLGYLKSAKHVNTEGIKGAAFASYGWDGGWVTERIERELKALGVKLVAPSVSAVDQGGVMGVRIHPDDLEKCRKLGRAMAEAVVKG